ncbi:hypothetical protein GCM10029964_015710 [Kibdelosporangium lantanae]
MANEFAHALRSAIAARGLPLDRLRERLVHRGHSLTSASLSYWQSGRSRPERGASLAALRDLESILEVPPGSLTDLLGPPRPRGRWTPGPVRPAMPAFWSSPAAVESALSEVDTRWDDRLTRISQHDEVFVGPSGEELAFVSHQVLRAEVDGPDRWVVIAHLDEHDRPLPRIVARRGCSVGRVVAEPSLGLLVAELRFPALARGETVITEHALVNQGPYPLATNYERKFRLPVRQYVLEVAFDPGALPVSCARRTCLDDGSVRVEGVRVGERVHGVVLNFGPGCFGFTWEWGSPTG